MELRLQGGGDDDTRLHDVPMVWIRWRHRHEDAVVRCQRRSEAFEMGRDPNSVAKEDLIGSFPLHVAAA
jgi:hypothetical protein